jgi:hypothetical protein
MRLPVKSEADAFRLTCALALVVALVVLVGSVFGGLAGVIVFLAILAAALLWDLRAGERRPLVDPSVARGETADHRVLVIANEPVTADAVWDGVRGRDGHGPVIEVLAPVLQSRTHFVTTDIDRETRAAQRRLDATVAAARRHGLRADGEVGDPINPLQSLSDELRRYEVDEVIVATHEAGRRNWLEDRMLERMGEELSIPVSQVVIDPSARGQQAQRV